MTMLMERLPTSTRLNPYPLVVTDVVGAVVDTGPAAGIARPWPAMSVYRDGTEWPVPVYMAELIGRLGATCEVWWCSTWGRDANRILGAPLGIAGFPMLDWSPLDGTKLDAAAGLIEAALVDGRQVVWIEARFGFPAIGLDGVTVVDTADPSGPGAVLRPSHLDWL